MKTKSNPYLNQNKRKINIKSLFWHRGNPERQRSWCGEWGVRDAEPRKRFLDWSRLIGSDGPGGQGLSASAPWWGQDCLSPPLDEGKAVCLRPLMHLHPLHSYVPDWDPCYQPKSCSYRGMLSFPWPCLCGPEKEGNTTNQTQKNTHTFAFLLIK